MDMNRFKNRSEKPLCKFGPGGEFVTDWPGGEMKAYKSNKNPLGKVLSTIAEIIGATIDPELIAELTSAPKAAQITDFNTKKEKTSIEAAKPEPDPKTIGHSQTDKQLPKQPMLFPDDRGIGRGVRRKPHNRIRAHRRTSRKTASRKVKRQNTLFEINLSSQSAA